MVDVDAAAGNARATVTQKGAGSCTLRSAAPLPRRPSRRAGAGGQHQLPAYRVTVEAYGSHTCYLGFVPSHNHTRSSGAAAPVTPTAQFSIHNYGGWYIVVDASRAGEVHDDPTYSGWTVMPPAASAYATTAVVPPVPAGGVVEFAVDYAAGTCRVAFYTPAAVEGGFVEAPHAKMELRFVATTAGTDGHMPLPARSVPTVPDSDVALYPAVEVFDESRNIWRFASV
jgi:hypothetical protein